MAALYIDADVAEDVAILLRQDGHYAVTFRGIRQQEARDDDQLLTAAQRLWILVTHNWKHFPLLHDAWRNWGRAWRVDPAPRHRGILILPHAAPALSVQRLNDLLRSNQPLDNELYRWFPSRGWVRQP